MDFDKRALSGALLAAMLFVIGAVGTAYGAEPAEPFDLKGDRLGMSLADFRAKYARTVQGHPEPLPFCSDARPGKEIITLLSEEWFQAAGIVTCRTNFPFEEIRGRSGDVRTTVANVQAKILIYHFVDAQLFKITVWISHDGFEELKAAMRVKFGPEKTAKAQTLQNAYGAKFDSDTLTWDNSVSSATLIERIGDVNTSALVLIHKELNVTADSRRPKKPQDL